MPPIVLLSSGEVTMILDSAVIRDHGGPGKEMTDAFAIMAAKTKGACHQSSDSEGTDDTAKVAGGISASCSLAATQAKGIILFQPPRDHNCFEALDVIGSAVFTGTMGTSLCDLNILCVPAVP